MESSSPIVLFTPCVRLQVIHIHSHLQHPRWPSVFFPLGEDLFHEGFPLLAIVLLPSVLFLSWEHLVAAEDHNWPGAQRCYKRVWAELALGFCGCDWVGGF